MVLNKSDYNPRNLIEGGFDPTSPVDSAALLAGSVIVLSFVLWAFNLADSKGSNLVNNLMGRLTGGVASTDSNPRVL